MSHDSKPMPAWAIALLERILPFRLHDDVIGDMAEAWTWIRAEEGRLRAWQWLCGQLARMLPVFLFDGINLGGSMFRNYITVALRNLRKRTFYSTLNIAGLAIGMGISLLILQYITFETSFDNWHEGVEQSYRINLAETSGGQTSSSEFSFHALAAIARDNVVGFEQVARLHPVYGTATVKAGATGEDVFQTSDFVYVDPDFFNIFSYPAIAGDPVVALRDPGQVVLTRSAAERFFGTVDAVGQEISIFSWMTATQRVGAVVEDHAGNSHITATLFAPLQALLDDPTSQYADDDGFSWTNFITYAQLTPGSDAADAGRALSSALMDVVGEELASREASMSTSLQPLMDIHLYGAGDGDPEAASGALRNVLFISIIGVFVLIIAWLNFVNLTTSRAMERAREVGVRKATGARRSQITAQFVIEALLTNAIALLCAGAIAWKGTGWLNDVAGTHLSARIWAEPRLWLFMATFFGLGTVASSLYPSLVIGRAVPAVVLRGQGGKGTSQARIRQGLVVFQFALSIAMLSGAWIVFRQIDHLQRIPPGFSMEQVLVVNRPGVIEDNRVYATSRNAFFESLDQETGILQAASSSMVPGAGFNLYTSSRNETTPEADAFPARSFFIGNGFLDTYDMPLLAGRAMDAQSEWDREYATLINETAMHAFGFASPDEAVGKRIVVGSSTPAEIVGVLSDFNWMSAKEPPHPVLIFPTRGGSYFSFRLDGRNMAETIARVGEAFAVHFPGNVYQYAFADERFGEIYASEERLRRLVTVFALFALLVASLGLVGLAALAAARRRQEMSIRKVLGANLLDIVRLLTGRFALLVVLGALLAAPAIWIVANQWLDNFGARMTLTPDVFILPALLVLVVALVASGYHVLRVATDNPVDGIRANG